MKENFKKRIITSFILVLIILISFFSNKYFWLMIVSLISLICYIEFNNLFIKIKKLTKKNKFKIRFIIIIYLINLIVISYLIYDQYLLFLILICILSDTGGYITGKTFGGKKLTKISPNKTVAGAIGSLIFSLIPFIYLVITNNYELFLFIFYNNDNLFYLFLISIIISILCQIGDLIISFLKRKADVKDTGTILPGHGGLLDRIDGIIFVVPISYFMQEFILKL